MQLGSVSSFSVKMIPLIGQSQKPVSDPSKHSKTADVLSSLISEAAYRSTESDEEIGIYNPLISGKLPHGSASIADSSMEPNQAKQHVKNSYSVTPNQVAILEPIQVVDITRKPNNFVPNPDFFRRLPATAPSPIAMVFQQSWNHYYSEVHFNAAAIGQGIFGRPLTIGEQSNYAFTAAHERLRSGKLENGKKAGFQMLMERPEAKSFQDKQLRNSLEFHERNYPTAYIDSEGHLTVGIGHKVVAGDNIKLGDTISQARVEQFYQNDSSKAMNAARQQAASIGITSSKMVAAIANANFQLGSYKHEFKNSWAALNDLIVAIQEYAPTHVQ